MMAKIVFSEEELNIIPGCTVVLISSISFCELNAAHNDLLDTSIVKASKR